MGTRHTGECRRCHRTSELVYTSGYTHCPSCMTHLRKYDRQKLVWCSSCWGHGFGTPGATQPLCQGCSNVEWEKQWGTAVQKIERSYYDLSTGMPNSISPYFFGSVKPVVMKPVIEKAKPWVTRPEQTFLVPVFLVAYVLTNSPWFLGLIGLIMVSTGANLAYLSRAKKPQAITWNVVEADAIKTYGELASLGFNHRDILKHLDVVGLKPPENYDFSVYHIGKELKVGDLDPRNNREIVWIGPDKELRYR